MEASLRQERLILRSLSRRRSPRAAAILGTIYAFQAARPRRDASYPTRERARHNHHRSRRSSHESSPRSSSRHGDVPPSQRGSRHGWSDIDGRKRTASLFTPSCFHQSYPHPPIRPHQATRHTTKKGAESPQPGHTRRGVQHLRG